MKYRYKRHSIKRSSFECSELVYYRSRSLYENRILPIEVRFYGLVRSKKVKVTISKLKNLCILTGRGRGVLKDLKLSRITLREMFSLGKIIGVKKGTW